MKQLLLFCFSLFLLPCSGQDDDKEFSKFRKDTVIKGDTIHLINRKEYVIWRFNKIASHLKLNRLDTIGPTNNQVEYRITLLTGPHTFLPYQGVCFHLTTKGPKSTLAAYHFGFNKSASSSKPFRVDTVFKTVTKEVDYNKFLKIIRGMYLEDHIEFNENHMSTGPTYLCIERHNLDYKRVIKENVWEGNFQDLIDLCFKTSGLQYVKNYR